MFHVPKTTLLFHVEILWCVSGVVAEEEEEVTSERFFLLYTDEGHKYFVPELGGEALWHLPEGAELIDESLPVETTHTHTKT